MQPRFLFVSVYFINFTDQIKHLLINLGGGEHRKEISTTLPPTKDSFIFHHVKKEDDLFLKRSRYLLSDTHIHLLNT